MNLYFTETHFFNEAQYQKVHFAHPQIQRISIYISSIICFDRLLLFKL